MAIQEHPGRPEVTADGAGKLTPKGFRADVQALRALAVTAVVLNHLWPARLTGGYVGVDVFFVISGFLISSHLVREIARTGRIKLGKFYARRVRRLLPAAFLVLLFTAIAAYFLLPFAQWQVNAQEVVASALYWENWLLAAKSVDYSQLTASASLTQHYWSLSVEEQFYLFWPLLLLVLFKIKWSRARVVGITIVAVASLAFSAYFTEIEKSQAYFITPVRVWEFAVGALIALGGAKLALPRIAANLASFAGLAMVIGAALLFNDQTEFPGVIALIPVLGTGLVIVAGTRPERQWHTVLTSSPPVQWLGNISYSLYLWHWPLIVLAPYALGSALDAGRMTFPQQLGVLALSLVLAQLSKRLIEDRGIAWPRLAASTRLTFTSMVAGMLALGLVAGGLVWTYGRHVTQAAKDSAEQGTGPCHGAAAMLPESVCPGRFGPARVVDMGPANEYYNAPASCTPTNLYLAGGKPTTDICDYSAGAKSPKVVWLIGDSHAQQWEAPLLEIARKNKWKMMLSYLGGCPVAGIQFQGYDGTNAQAAAQCMTWTASMVGVIAKSKPSYVFTSFFARDEAANDNSGRSQAAQYQDGLDPYWSAWTKAGAQVVVMGDPPLNGDVRQSNCVALNPHDPTGCAVDRATAQPPDPLAMAAKASADPNVSLIDLTDYFCDQQKCYGVVGNVAVYYDPNHLNLEFSSSLEPMIAAAIGVPDR